jgi:hypothetical protein
VGDEASTQHFGKLEENNLIQGTEGVTWMEHGNEPSGSKKGWEFLD